MEKVYVPTSMDRLVFNELKKFFLSTEVSCFLDEDEMKILNHYFSGDKPRSLTYWEVKDEIAERGISEKDLDRLFNKSLRVNSKLRTRHRLYALEIERGVHPSEMRSFLPWSKWPRGVTSDWPE